MSTREIDRHPEIEKIMDYIIPKRKIRSDLIPTQRKDDFVEELELRIGDLIDEQFDIRFDQNTGKVMMTHSGILAIWEGIGAELYEPKLEKTGANEYQVIQGVKFADGTVFFATGETSERNTDSRDLSGKFPVNQAHIRAINKAITRGLGLYRIMLTEEEADEFKQSQVAKLKLQFEEAVGTINEKAKAKEERLLKLLGGMMNLVSLPSSDEKYPNSYLADVKEDVDYLEHLRKGEDKIIGFVANQFLKEITKKEALIQESEEDFSNEAQYEKNGDENDQLEGFGGQSFEDEQQVSNDVLQKAEESAGGEQGSYSEEDDTLSESETDVESEHKSGSSELKEETTAGSMDISEVNLTEEDNLEILFGGIAREIEEGEQLANNDDDGSSVATEQDDACKEED
jgi:hypothetical protein